VSWLSWHLLAGTFSSVSVSEKGIEAILTVGGKAHVGHRVPA
jgi:hypothetical protein